MNGICVVTRDLDAYLAEQDRADRRDMAIEAVQAELYEQYKAEELAARMKAGCKDNRYALELTIREVIDDELPQWVADLLLGDEPDFAEFGRHFRYLYVKAAKEEAEREADARAEQDAERELDDRIRSAEEDAAAAAYEARNDDDRWAA